MTGIPKDGLTIYRGEMDEFQEMVRGGENEVRICCEKGCTIGCQQTVVGVKASADRKPEDNFLIR